MEVEGIAEKPTETCRSQEDHLTRATSFGEKNISCTHADSNRRPFACKANVITDYTMRANTGNYMAKFC